MACLVIFTSLLLGVSPEASANAQVDAIVDGAERLDHLETLIIAQAGEVIAERGYRGQSTTSPTNVKSASKTVMSALVGIAIDRGILGSVDQPIAELLSHDLPDDPNPRIELVTVGDLLSMQAGLSSTSGRNYGAWVASPNWVRAALARPFEADPGGAMIYQPPAVCDSHSSHRPIYAAAGAPMVGAVGRIYH
jgi:CubicO group peptidase (beta-lactamase class C family)